MLFWSLVDKEFYSVWRETKQARLSNFTKVTIEFKGVDTVPPRALRHKPHFYTALYKKNKCICK